jgi:hypothetical protein
MRSIVPATLRRFRFLSDSASNWKMVLNCMNWIPKVSTPIPSKRGSNALLAFVNPVMDPEVWLR